MKKSMKKRTNYLKSLFVVLLLATFFPINVLAATITSNWNSIPASSLNDPAGVSYNYRAALRSESRYAVGTAEIYGDKSIPQE